MHAGLSGKCRRQFDVCQKRCLRCSQIRADIVSARSQTESRWVHWRMMRCDTTLRCMQALGLEAAVRRPASQGCAAERKSIVPDVLASRGVLRHHAGLSGPARVHRSGHFEIWRRRLGALSTGSGEARGWGVREDLERLVSRRVLCALRKRSLQVVEAQRKPGTTAGKTGCPTRHG